MSRYPSLMGWGMLAVVAVTSFCFYQQHAGQARLDLELAQLGQRLSEANEKAAQNADYTVKSMRYTIEKNRYQRRDVAILKATEAFHTHTNTLRSKIRALRQVLLRATGNLDSDAGLLRHPDEARTVTQLLGSRRPAASELRQQLTAYVDTARLLNPLGSISLGVSSLDNAPVVVALASLTQVESDLLAGEIQTLRHLAQMVGASEPRAKVVAVATAQSNMVTPGATYRAHLLLVKSLMGPSIHMTCNGQPLAIGPDGAGQVRFRAPSKVGPATWHGAIQVRLRGRDTTFQMQVPYRVSKP